MVIPSLTYAYPTPGAQLLGPTQRVRTTATADRELNGLLEDLLPAVDGPTDPRYARHNLVVVMQIASDIEQELLLADISLSSAVQIRTRVPILFSNLPPLRTFALTGA